MKVKSFQYKDNQWSVDEFPAMDSKNTLITVFCAPEYINNQQPLKDLCKAYPDAIIVGCSSAGEISGVDVDDHSISVAVLKLDRTRIDITSENVKGKSSTDIGRNITKSLLKSDLKAIFVLSDGLDVNGSQLVQGMNKDKPSHVVVTGGLAGDGSAFKSTWVIDRGEIKLNTVIAVGFYGEHIKVAHGSKGGWDIFGPERLITKSKDNTLYELDGKPALLLYKEYLGDKAKDLPASGLLFPLSIRKNANDENMLVRTILSVDKKHQSLTFAGDVPQGYLAQLMRANFDRLIEGATEAARITNDIFSMEKQKDSDQLLIAISCVGRKLLLGERTSEETESTLEGFNKNTRQVGFYSYGELSPYTNGSCELHNQTMTLTCISEDEEA